MTTSFAQPDVDRTPVVEQCLVLPGLHHAPPLDDSCLVCGYPGVGAVTYVTSERGYVVPFCSNHCVEILAAAILASPLTPPRVSLVDVDQYRSGGWAS